MRSKTVGTQRLGLAMAFLICCSVRITTAAETPRLPTGMWRFVLTFEEGSGFDPAEEMLSFSSDGRALTSFLLDGEAATRWGEWKQRAGGIDYTSYTLLDPEPGHDLLRVRCRMKMDSVNVMTGACVGELVDSDGNVTELIRLTAQGTRLPLVEY